MTLKSGSGQACAACKHQRRRCTPECLLAPFFPANQPKIFKSVHRLFGVKHIQNLLKELHPDQKPIAVHSLKFHAAMRERYPVYGCLVEIQHLMYRIHLLEEELHAVLQQLASYRNNQREITDNVPQYNNNDGNEDFVFTTAHLDSKENDDEDVDLLWIQQAYSYNNSNSKNGDSVVMQAQPMPISQEVGGQDFAFFDSVDDKQSYVGSKEVYESSLESSVKDCRESVEQMAENELRTAAACFSLTSVNY